MFTEKQQSIHIIIRGNQWEKKCRVWNSFGFVHSFFAKLNWKCAYARQREAYVFALCIAKHLEKMLHGHTIFSNESFSNKAQCIPRRSWEQNIIKSRSNFQISGNLLFVFCCFRFAKNLVGGCFLFLFFFPFVIRSYSIRKPNLKLN